MFQTRWLFLLAGVALAGCSLPTEGLAPSRDGGGGRDTGRSDGGDSCVPATETCNGVDDDCDGEVDEGVTRGCGLDVGACSHGTETCVAGAWSGDCVGAVGPMDEVCEGSVDENCDGTVDEGCACTPGAMQPCGLDVGACMQGMQACGADAVWGLCVGAVGPSAEVCDGAVDDDCDGTVDNGCACTNGDTQPCAGGTDAGVCSRGTQTCATGAWGACVGRVDPGTEVCEGTLDEDCDGMVDNGCACTNGDTRQCAGGTNRGVCSRGTQTCATGAWGACVGRVDPGTEVCEGTLDEDCDGVVDNGCACTNGDTRPCGPAVGECAAGTQTCASGAWGSCAGGTGPGTESCNGLDDDCDGSIDEGGVCSWSGCTWAEDRGHAYQFCDPMTQLSWNEARLACEAGGYHLVQIDDDMENSFVWSQADMVRTTKWWTGATDEAVEQTFVWPDGSQPCQSGQMAGPPYCHWRPMRPRNDTNKNCVMVDTNHGPGTEWDDEACGNGHPFVCEAP